METKDTEFEFQDDGKSYIAVSDDMRLLMSPRNWQLQKKVVAQSDTKSQKAGEVSWASFRYYMTLESAIKDIVHINTSKTFFNDIQGLQKAYAKVVDELSKALNVKINIEV